MREHIKRTALDLFVERGYDGTSLRQIAEALNVTKAAVYYHFKTKEGILAALFEERIRPVEDLIAWPAPSPPTSPPDKSCSADTPPRSLTQPRFSGSSARTAPPCVTCRSEPHTAM
ncbi:helix-turn-helix domain-containing protein [Streptomyces sp. NPDC050392]|uniref:TetR/AcrR family transcriptional regulator n=1 Tax=Streptomyces sp. NPDC050392 TaxID=3155782 RepID=UPI00341A873E